MISIAISPAEITTASSSEIVITPDRYIAGPSNIPFIIASNMYVIIFLRGFSAVLDKYKIYDVNIPMDHPIKGYILEFVTRKLGIRIE